MNIAFIPARCGSKSIPFKNIKIFCGKPLIFWSLEALQNSDLIDLIFVATDCEEIRSVVSKFQFSKVQLYNRDKKNADDSASTESVMLEFIEKKDFDEKDMFVLVQATSPFTQAKDFSQAFKQLQAESADSILTCVRTKRFFWDDYNKPINYNYNFRPRRQDFDGTLMESGAFYINSVGNIKHHGNRLSGKIAIYEMEEFSAIEIDEENDWLVAEKLMNKFFLSKKPIADIKLFLSDVDGTLTDAGMYYSEDGNEMKKFNTHDGKGFELLQKSGIKTGIITSEDTEIVSRRAKKLKVDYLYQGLEHKEKLSIVRKICKDEGIALEEVAYIGDDINCKELLENVGLAACPENALEEIKSIPNILILTRKGGDGAVREFVKNILSGV